MPFKIFIKKDLMKNIIRKILKESEDEFEWVKGLDVAAAEQEIYKPFKNMHYEWSVEGKEIYDTLIKFGVIQPTELKEIGEILENEFQQVWDNGRDYGYDRGYEDHGCDGCCDDYYYYEDVEDMKEEAEDRGYERGYETGVSDAKGESEDEIEELRGQINELQSEIEELRDRLSDTDDDLD